MIIHDALSKGRRSVDIFPQVEVLRELTWEEDLDTWSLRFSICLELDNCSNNTYWVALIPSEYPKGEISVYPDYELGISETHPHQLNNGLDHLKPLCKSGKICLDRPFDKFNKLEFNEYEKLAWYIERLIQWIRDANSDILLSEGDYFEIPDTSIFTGPCLIYDEDYFSVEVRNDNESFYGYVDISLYMNNFFVKRFNDCKGNLVFEVLWGSNLENAINSNGFQVGGWILLEKPLVVNKWQIPNTYSQLKDALGSQSICFRDIISKIAIRLRDQKQHLLLIGYPAPLIIGHEPDSIIWHALQLPILSSGNKFSAGFRKNEAGWLQNDLTTLLSGSKKIQWIKSENWNSNHTLARGKVNQELCRMRVLIIGAGCLGSLIALMLVRSGVNNLTIIDDDIFEIGNIARHVLDVESVGQKKANELVKKLNKVNPHAKVVPIDEKFDSTYIEKISDYDVIIDCTGENEVLEILSKTNGSQWLCSASFSFEVNNIYLYIGRLKYMTIEKYLKEFSEEISKDNSDYDKCKIPWEGIGCWSPVFPATYMDVSLVASVVVSTLNQKIANNTNDGEYLLFKKKFDSEGNFIGVMRVDSSICR